LPALDLERVTSLMQEGTAGPMDGVLGPEAARIEVPGLAPEWPISPSGLERLLGCPHQFLFQALLGFEESASAPSLREIGQPAYGGLFHLAAERLYREHGRALTAREGTLTYWLEHGAAIADQVFTAFLDEYPLVGGAVRAHQRDRLRRDLQELVRYDWNAGTGRRFVAVERIFGRPDAVRVETPVQPLFLRGRVDRIDVEGSRTLIRDLKTGKAHRRVGREREPNVSLDIQIAAYGLATRVCAAEWDVPAQVGVAYAYFGRGLAAERDWRDDFGSILEPASRAWLAIAAMLLAERAFPRTPDAEDCEWCPFQPVCGDGVYARSARLLIDAQGVQGEFGRLKGLEEKT
jgi:RecB family exonuclease